MSVNILEKPKQSNMRISDKTKIMIVYLTLIFTIISLSSCTKEGFLQPNRNIEMSIDTRLPKDSNGYFYFKLYSSETQNIHTISGSIRINGRIPDEPRVKVEWENNLYWNLVKGDTIAIITKTYLNYYTGQFTVVKLPPMISNVNALVPTINKVCYNSADGSINTVIAPMWNMKGDTMTIVARYADVVKVEKIILK
jgi:hypothetical protein